MLTAAGVDAKQVNLKTLLPLMEHASLEEDPGLSDRWAALLANAADATSRIEVKPVFSEILKQLTPAEVRLLDFLFKATTRRNMPLRWRAYREETKVLYLKEHPEASEDFDYCLAALMHNALLAGIPNIADAYIIRNKIGQGDDAEKLRPDAIIHFTALGVSFIQACTAPKPNSLP